MKTILLLLVFHLSFLGNLTSETEPAPDWQTDYEKALKISRKDKKNILLYFTGSDWCPPCKQLKQDLFLTEEFNELAQDYVLLYVDIPRRGDILTSDQLLHNKRLLKRYNKKGVFPLMVALSEKEKVIDEYSGYSMNGEVRYHLKFLKKNR